MTLTSDGSVSSPDTRKCGCVPVVKTRDGSVSCHQADPKLDL